MSERYEKVFIEFMKKLADDLRWAINQLSDLPKEKIPTPTSVKPRYVHLFEELPPEIGVVIDAPLLNGEGASDIGKRPNLSSKYVLLYFNAIFNLFLAHGQRYFCVPLLIARLVPHLNESNLLCRLIWGNSNPCEQWYTYVNHLGNQLFDLGIVKRYRDKKGILWYRWTDEFLVPWLNLGGTLGSFFTTCKRMGVKDSEGIVGIEGLIQPAPHEFLRMF